MEAPSNANGTPPIERPVPWRTTNADEPVAVTAIVRLAEAATHVASPACAALSVHEPAFFSVTVVPLTVQTVVDCDVTLTGRLEEAAGLTSSVGPGGTADQGPGR